MREVKRSKSVGQWKSRRGETVNKRFVCIALCPLSPCVLPQLLVIVAMRFRSALSRKATASDSLGRKSQVLGFWGMQVARRRQEPAVALRWINADHATISCSWRPRLSRVIALRLGGLTGTSVAKKHNNPQDKPVVLESHSLLSPTPKCDPASRTISQANIRK